MKMPLWAFDAVNWATKLSTQSVKNTALAVSKLFTASLEIFGDVA